MITVKAVDKALLDCIMTYSSPLYGKVKVIGRKGRMLQISVDPPDTGPTMVPFYANHWDQFLETLDQLPK